MANTAVGLIYTTNDYEQFKHLIGNRDVDGSRVKRIEESINAVGYVMNPIVVNEKMEVIDGQGRLEVMKKMGLPVYYVVSEGAGVAECRQLNIGQKNWYPIDFIKSYADGGNENYERLLKLIKSKEGTMFSADLCVSVVKNKIAFRRTNATKAFKSGEFTASQDEIEQADRAMQFALMHDAGVRGISGSLRVISSTVCWVVRNTNVDKYRLGKILDEKYPIFSPVCDEAYTKFLDELSGVYNRGLRGIAKRIYLSEEYGRFQRGEAK